jgi:hypothetical protein
MRKASPVSLSIALALTCCTRPSGPELSGPAPASAVPVSAADEQPMLVSCTAYPPPGRPERRILTTYSVGVVLTLVVASDGSVASGREAPLTSAASAIKRTPSDVARALTVAKTCRYQPARIRGQAVAVRDVQQVIILEPR